MGKPSKELFAFMQKHNVSSDEVWEVRAGGAWAIKHSAIERLVAENDIVFDRPSVVEINTADKIMVVCVFGKMGERSEWSFGEASPANCKNAYPASMAEKRAKDRVALKLLNAHGALYSEDEADDFAERPRQNPHVTRPADIVPATNYDAQGQPIDNIPLADPGAGRKLRVADQRPIFEALQKEIHTTGSIIELQEWATTNKNRLADLKPDWQEMLRGVYAEHLEGLRELARGDDQRMAS